MTVSAYLYSVCFIAFYTVPDMTYDVFGGTLNPTLLLLYTVSTLFACCWHAPHFEYIIMSPTDFVIYIILFYFSSSSSFFVVFFFFRYRIFV